MKEFVFELQRFGILENSLTSARMTNLDDEDWVKNYGDLVTITLGDGNDTVENHGNLVTISSGGGNDTITSSGDNVVIQKGAGRKYIDSDGNEVFIQVGDDGGNVGNVGDKVTVTSGAGRTVINSRGNDNLLFGSDTGDRISITGSRTTLDAGEGDNYIYAGYVTGNATYSAANSLILTGSGKDRAQLISAPASTISTGECDDYVWASKSHNSVILTDGGADSVHLYDSPTSTISTGEGNDYVSTNNGKNSVILTGDGDDTIISNGDNVTITGGAGNDLITLTDNTNTSITSNNVVIEYAYGDGLDTVVNFSVDDTIKLYTDTAYTTMKSGGDLYVIFDEFNSIAFKDVGQHVGRANLVTISGGATSAPESPATVPKNTVTIPATPAQTVSANPANPITVPATTPTVPATSTETNSGGTTNIYNGPVTINTTINNNTTVNNNFVTFSGGGNQTISDFVTGRTPNSNVLNFATALTALRRSSSMLVFNSADGSVLHVHNSSDVDEIIQYSTDGENVSLAKVGRAEQNNSFTYEDGVNFYSGGEYTDVLRVTNIEGKNIWLDGSAGVGYSGVNNIDASNSSGNNTLAGDAGSNAIIAGGGNDSLWGSSGDDTLIGGTGENMFWFGKGDGHDVAQNVGENDVVNLYDVTLSDIISAETSPTLISINLVTGSVLDVKNYSSSKSTFKLADGSAWRYNRDSGQWQTA